MFLRYLDFFRDRLAAKLRELPAGELRHSRLASGWTPLELPRHLTYMERRWLEWGFEGRAVADPWGDRRDGRWYVGPEESLQDLRCLFHMLQEYARHLGHLDIACELAGMPAGQ